MKYISLFSGIGGFDLAFRSVGMICDTVCEIDKNAQSVLTRRFPEAKLFDDVHKIGKDTHEKGSIDIICGGFPCQDLSVAGKRKGIIGERSGLWFEFARIIDELESRWVVVENVPGLLSSNKGKDFAVIIRWLAERGYGVSWRVLDAQYFGVPQRRRRVFIVASFGNGRAAEVLFEREGMSRNTPPRKEAGEEITETFTIRSGKDGGGKGYLGQESLPMTLGGQEQYLAKTITTREAASLDSETMKFIVSPTLNSSGAGTSRPGGQGAEPEFYIPVSWNWQSGGDVRHDFNERPMLQSSQVPAVGVRRLTPTECERLQGFPDGWTEGQSDSARYRQLGNAVAVPVVEWIARRIMEIENA